MNEPAFVHFEPDEALPARRKSDQFNYETIAHKVSRMANDLDKITASLSAMEASMLAHMSERERIIADLLAKAFPDGDPDGHRRYHEASIKQAEARAKMWADVQVSTAKWGIVGVLGWMVFSLWTAFLQGPSK